MYIHAMNSLRPRLVHHMFNPSSITHLDDLWIPLGFVFSFLACALLPGTQASTQARSIVHNSEPYY
jgi:hypothetical protein